MMRADTSLANFIVILDYDLSLWHSSRAALGCSQVLGLTVHIKINRTLWELVLSLAFHAVVIDALRVQSPIREVDQGIRSLCGKHSVGKDLLSWLRTEVSLDIKDWCS